MSLIIHRKSLLYSVRIERKTYNQLFEKQSIKNMGGTDLLKSATPLESKPQFKLKITDVRPQ